MTRLYKLDAVCNRLTTLGAKKPMLTVRHSTLHSLGTIETEKECCRTKRENRQSVGVVSCELSRDHFCVSRHFYTRLCMCGRLNLSIWNPSCCFICFIMFHRFIKSFLGWVISVLLFIRFIRKSQDAKLVSTSLFESLLVSFCHLQNFRCSLGSFLPGYVARAEQAQQARMPRIHRGNLVRSVLKGTN